mmetsp:Transcript_2622/g.6303  ORF Transcript_2622/g.6303 Transcript_2622/m.6303 type:complete len:111 (+) Transcript_2622:1391-1723(+)
MKDLRNAKNGEPSPSSGRRRKKVELTEDIKKSHRAKKHGDITREVHEILANLTAHKLPEFLESSGKRESTQRAYTELMLYTEKNCAGMDSGVFDYVERLANALEAVMTGS